jgi:hypothetical protein
MSSGQSGERRVALRDLVTSDWSRLVFFSAVATFLVLAFDFLEGRAAMRQILATRYPSVSGRILKCKKILAPGISLPYNYDLEYAYAVIIQFAADNPSPGFTAAAWLIIALSTAAVWICVRRSFFGGGRDLVIDRANQTLTPADTSFPFGHTPRPPIAVPWSSIAEITVEGGSDYQFVPVAVVIQADGSQTRAPLSPSLFASSARALAIWVREQLGHPAREDMVRV